MANIIHDIISLEVSTYLHSMEAMYNGWRFAPPESDDATTYLPSGTVPSPFPTPPAPPISTLADHRTTPHAILEDRDQHYLICFLPNKAGIILDDPILISKPELTHTHPHLIRAWDAQQQHKQTEAARRDHKIQTFLRDFQSNPTTPSPPRPHTVRLPAHSGPSAALGLSQTMHDAPGTADCAKSMPGLSGLAPLVAVSLERRGYSGCSDKGRKGGRVCALCEGGG
jgi:hypothetical protein